MVKIEESWRKVLHDEFDKNYFAQIKQFILNERGKGKTIFPPGSQIFAAFDYTPFDKVKVVIIGQDPYHGDGQAHGLCFSVQRSVSIPPSLQNIYKEIKDDLGLPIPTHGNLTSWAQQGVLLLNAILTVNRNEAASHKNAGWENFTNEVIRKLSEKRPHLVFILWGKFAQEKASLIDSSKHLVLKAAHPSPFSAYNGFFGCKHFSRANEYLRNNGLDPIHWNID